MLDMLCERRKGMGGQVRLNEKERIIWGRLEMRLGFSLWYDGDDPLVQPWLLGGFASLAEGRDGMGACLAVLCALSSLCI